MTPARRRNLSRLLSPRHIAFIGGRDAITAITEARRRGFKGEMWAVNPRRSDLAGVPCFASVADLPEAPDAAYVAVPALAAVSVVADLARRGAGGAVCYSAGFKEAGPVGIEAEVALKDAVGDMALIGPNCYGFINYLGKSALWSFAHGGNCPGYGAAIVTQSGMFSSDITMTQRHLPLAYMISAGNQAVIGLEDFLDHLCEEPEVRAIGLHIEGLQNVPRFERAALKALELGKPVVALKTGTSRIGESLTVSHTGSLSGANELYDALFSRCNVISVSNPSDFVETLKLLCTLGAPRGRRVAGFTCSGGGATMLADHAEKIGLDFPLFPADAKQTLSDRLPDIATVSNPLDYTTPIWGQPGYTKPVFEAAIRGLAPDIALLVQDYPAEGLDESKIYYENDALAFAEAAALNDVPAAVCATFPENLDDRTRALLIERGIAPMQGIHETLNAIALSANWAESKETVLTSSPPPLARQEAPDLAPHRADPSFKSQPAQVAFRTEAEGKDWLRRQSFQVPNGLCVAAAAAAQAAREIGFPVAVKMMSPALPHKTEAGAVALGLASPEEVTNATKGIRDAVRAYDPEAERDAFLIEAMTPPPLAELILGLRRDPDFGVAMTLGSGGVLVELMADVQTLLLPCRASEIESALRNLKVGRLMAGFRGAAAANFGLIAGEILRLATAMSAASEIRELEVNPLFVYPDRLVAVDVLLQA